MVCSLLSLLRAQYMLYQNIHWEVSGPPFYGNHLLFQRLYESVQQDVDNLAEKVVAHFGVQAVAMRKAMPEMDAFCRRWCQVESLSARAMVSEADFQRLVQKTLSVLETEGRLTIGVANLLEEMADRHETNMYLIQQTLRAPGV